MARHFLSIGLVLPIATLAVAQPKAVGPQVVHLKVRPAVPPTPALKVQLLPDGLEQTVGDARPLYGQLDQLISGEARSEIIGAWKNHNAAERSVALLETLRGLTSKNETALRHVRKAALRERCVWNTELLREDGFHAVLPSLVSIRTAGRLVDLQIRIALAEERIDDAIAGLRAGFSVARHCASGPTLVSALVGADLAETMAKRIQEFVQEPGVPNLYWALTLLPRPFVSLHPAVRTERAGADYTFPELRNLSSAPLTPEQAQALLDRVAELFSLVPVTGETRTVDETKRMIRVWVDKTHAGARQRLIGQGIAAEQVDAMPRPQVALLAAYRAYQHQRDDMLKWFGLPYAQARLGFVQIDKAFEKASKDAVPFDIFLPAVPRAYALVTRVDRRIAALRLVEALRWHAAGHGGQLPGALTDITVVPLPSDPITGEPFIYKLEAGIATIDMPAPEGLRPTDALRYVVTIVR